MLTSVASGGLLLAAILSPAVTVGVLGGMALWGTTVASSWLTKRWAKQTREEIKRNHKIEKSQGSKSQNETLGHVARDTVLDLVLIDGLDGSLGGTFLAAAFVAATAPVTAPVYAVYQRFKGIPELKQDFAQAHTRGAETSRPASKNDTVTPRF